MKPVRFAAAIVALLAACAHDALAQRTPVAPPQPPAVPAAPPVDAAPEDSFTLPSDPRVAVKLDAAAEYIHDEDWDKAVRVLQQLLDLKQDQTAVIGGEKHPRTVSARAEAQRLLASLPPAGRKAYQEAQGPRAAELLKEAIKDKDDEKMGAVACRFLATDSGPDALGALAALHYEAGRYRLAALSYRKLLELRDAAKWSPEDLFRAADAFHRAGDKANADLSGKQLLERIGDEGLTVGDRKLSRDEVQKELSKPVEVSGEWAMFGGDAGRSAQGDGGMPFLYRRWMHPTTVASSPDRPEFGVRLGELFKKASDRLTQVNQQVLPPQFPAAAAVTFKMDGSKHSLVVYRNHTGVAAVDLNGGKLVGFTAVEGSFDWMMHDASHQNVLNQWAQAYIDQGQRPGVLFENTTIGTLSTDGDFAYTVEDLAVPAPTQFHMNMGFPGNPNPWGWPQDVTNAITHNRLRACDLTAGCKSVWDAALFDDPKTDLGDSFFLGPPLDGRLFVLAEKQQELRLICLESVPTGQGLSREPRVVFVLPLGTVSDGLSAKASLRRLHAAQLAYGDGILICPTHAGCVVGVDLLTRSVSWVHRYEQAKAVPVPVQPIPILPPGQAPGVPESGWRNGAPVVSGGAVVFAAPDGVPLTCLDLETGAVRWKEPHEDDDLYLAGVFDGRVLVVGKKSCRALDLSNGKTLWTVDTGVPSGWGAAAGGVYYLPLRETAASKDPEVCAIDLAKGQVAAHVRPPQQVVPRLLGNLQFFNGVMISQTTEDVIAYPPLKARLKEMDAKLAGNPNDPEAYMDRAELRLEWGNAAGAAEDLGKALDNKASAAMRDRMAELLKRATPEQQKELEEVRRRLEELKK